MSRQPEEDGEGAHRAGTAALVNRQLCAAAGALRWQPEPPLPKARAALVWATTFRRLTVHALLHEGH